ncbi:MAG: hypothetical protein WCF26_27850 [Candidatus Sulfotelmatobacter sp.]
MPKTPVHEHGTTASSQDNVRVPCQIRRVKTIAITEAKEKPTHGNFWSSIFDPNRTDGSSITGARRAKT